VTESADLVNKYRTTSVQIVAIVAQIFGGIAILIGLYFAWGNLTTAREGQITERFTRAIDQLGNEKMEIRLGGIYALERISTESKKDYWPIMEILTAYVRKNSSVEVIENKKVMHLAMHIQSNDSTIREVPEERKISLDIQAVLTVLGERKYSFNNGEYKCLNLRKAHLEGADLREAYLEGADLREAYIEGADLREAYIEGADLREAYLEGADLRKAHLEGADLRKAHLEGAGLFKAHLKGADLREAYLEGSDLIEANLEGDYLLMANLEGAYLLMAHLEGAYLIEANLEGASLVKAHLEGASLFKAHLEGADLRETHLEGADLRETHLEEAYLREAYLEGAKNLTIDQLSKVKTLYDAKLDDELRESLENKYPDLYKQLTTKPK